MSLRLTTALTGTEDNKPTELGEYPRAWFISVGRIFDHR